MFALKILNKCEPILFRSLAGIHSAKLQKVDWSPFEPFALGLAMTAAVFLAR